MRTNGNGISSRSSQKKSGKVTGSSLNAAFSNTLSVGELDGSPAAVMRRSLWEPPSDLLPTLISATSKGDEGQLVLFPCELTHQDYARRILDTVGTGVKDRILEITQGSVTENSGGLLVGIPPDDQGDIFCLLRQLLGSRHLALGDTDDAMEVQQYVATALGLNGVGAVTLFSAAQALLDTKPRLGAGAAPLSATEVLALFAPAKQLLEVFGAAGAAAIVQLASLRRMLAAHDKFKERRSVALGLSTARLPATATATASPKTAKQTEKGPPAAAPTTSSSGECDGSAVEVARRAEELIEAMGDLDGTPARALGLLLTRLKVMRDELAVLLERCKSAKSFDAAQKLHDFMCGMLSPAIGLVQEAVAGGAASEEVDSLCAAASALVMAMRTQQSAAAARGQLVGPGSAAALEELLARLVEANNRLSSTDLEAPILLDSASGNAARCEAEADVDGFVTGRNLLALRHPVDGRSVLGLLASGRSLTLLEAVSQLWVPGIAVVEPEAKPRPAAAVVVEDRDVELTDPDEEAGAEQEPAAEPEPVAEPVFEPRPVALPANNSPDTLAKFLKSVGYSASELKLAGYSCTDAAACGFTCREVYAAGWRKEQLREGNYSCADFRAIKFTCKQVRALGYSCKEAFAAGYTCKDLCQAGFSCREARRAGFSKLRDLRVAGYSCRGAREAGFSCKEAKDAGFHDPRDMKLAGYSCQDARDAGYKWNDCVTAGYTYEEAVETGFPYTPASSYSAAYWNDHYTKCVDLRDDAKAAEQAKRA